MKINYKQIGLIMIGFLALEIFSFGAVFNPSIFWLLVLAAAALTVYRTEYGLLIILAELFIGSMGHMFYLEIDGGRLPIRIGLFGVFMLVFGIKFLYQLLRERSRARYWEKLKDFSGGRFFLILAAFVVISLGNAFLGGNELQLIFNDFNAWPYLFLVIPLTVVYGSADQEKFERLKTWFLAGALWLSLKTLFVLFIFTHDASVADAIYYWLRRTLGGEVTVAIAGWPRVFIQGQIFSGIAFLLVFWLRPVADRFKDLFNRDNIGAWLLGSLFFSTVLVSLSRSFWVGFAVSIGLGVLALWRLHGFRAAARGTAWLALGGFMSFVIIYLLMIIPYNQGLTVNIGESLLDRVKSENEPAAASRWALLPVLWEEIGREPFFGQGYGATVTYLTHDPRVLATNPSGEYKTYAFEWGYLDIWLKLGLLGLIAYLGLLGKLIWDAWRRGVMSGDKLYIGLAAGLVFLAATNFFTPYLNHPLGIGFLVICSCLIWTNKVY